MFCVCFAPGESADTKHKTVIQKEFVFVEVLPPGGEGDNYFASFMEVFGGGFAPGGRGTTSLAHLGRGQLYHGWGGGGGASGECPKYCKKRPLTSQEHPPGRFLRKYRWVSWFVCVRVCVCVCVFCVLCVLLLFVFWVWGGHCRERTPDIAWN